MAVAVLFAAVVLFVASGIAIAIDHAFEDRLTWLPVGLALLGMALIVVESGAMVIECGFSAAQIRAEIAVLRDR